MPYDSLPASVPSQETIERLMKESTSSDPGEMEKLARLNARALLDHLFPDTPFKLNLRSSRRFGTRLSVAWPLLPQAPSEAQVRSVLSCFEASLGLVIKASVRPNAEGLSPGVFRDRFGWVPALVFNPRPPNPADLAAAMEKNLPSASSFRSPRL